MSVPSHAAAMGSNHIQSDVLKGELGITDERKNFYM
jgi:hypothetical protein